MSIRSFPLLALVCEQSAPGIEIFFDWKEKPWELHFMQLIHPNQPRYHLTTKSKNVMTAEAYKNKNMKTENSIEFSARTKAFTSEGVRKNKFRVDLDNGTVRVWDSVAGQYTTVHGMSPATEARIRKAARRLA